MSRVGYILAEIGDLDAVREGLFVSLIYMCEALCLLTGHVWQKAPAQTSGSFFDMLRKWASYR